MPLPQSGAGDRGELAEWRGHSRDTHIEPGTRVSPFYDSLLAKIIASGADRAIALDRLRQALRSAAVSGIVTNLDFQRQLLDEPEFEAGGVDTGFVNRVLLSGAAPEVRGHG